jgi:predicted protein tyrosine phosphatase
MVNILFICSANKERSPTAEQVFKDVPNWIVRSAGTERDAVKKVTSNLLKWADEIVVMENYHKERILEINNRIQSKIHVLNIEDRYYRCNSELIGILIMKMSRLFSLENWVKRKFDCKRRPYLY